MRNLYSTDAKGASISNLLWYHRGKVLLVWLIGSALTLAYLSLAPRNYQAEAKLYVRLGRESVALDPTATNGQIISVADTRESEVYAVEELLTSRVMAEKIVDELGPKVILEAKAEGRFPPTSQWLGSLDRFNLNPLRVYSERDKAIKAFQKSLGVTAANKSSVIRTSYRAKDPKLALSILERLVAHAKEQHVEVHRTPGSQAFFVKQAELLKGTLAYFEQRLRDLKSESGVASLETQRKLQLENIDKLESALVTAQADQRAAEAEVQHRRGPMEATPTLIVTERVSGAPQNVVQALREKLYDLEVKESELAAKFTDEHPDLQLVRQQLTDAKTIASAELATEQVTEGVNAMRQTSELAVQEKEASVVALEARTKSLETALASSREQLDKLNDAELEVNRLEREIQLAQANYRKYAENLESTRINQELEDAQISSLNLMQPPTVGETPVSPQPIVTLTVGFGLTILGGVAVAFLASPPPQQVSPPSVVTNGVYANGAHTNGVHVEDRPSLPVELEWRADVLPAQPR